MERTDAAAAAARDALERQVNAATQVDTSRDATRRAYADLAEFLFSRGDVGGAIKAWTRVREYTTNARQTAGASVGMLEAALLGRSWSVVEATLPRGDLATEGRENPL